MFFSFRTQARRIWVKSNFHAEVRATSGLRAKEKGSSETTLDFGPKKRRVFTFNNRPCSWRTCMDLVLYRPTRLSRQWRVKWLKCPNLCTSTCCKKMPSQWMGTKRLSSLGRAFPTFRDDWTLRAHGVVGSEFFVRESKTIGKFSAQLDPWPMRKPLHTIALAERSAGLVSRNIECHWQGHWKFRGGFRRSISRQIPPESIIIL